MASLLKWLLAVACIGQCVASDAALTKTESKDYSSIILLGGIAFVMAMYYMVNSHFKDVGKTTWSMISTSVSIFAAVMAYNMMKHLFYLILDLEPVHVTFASHSVAHALPSAHAVDHHRLLSAEGHGKVTMVHVWMSIMSLAFWWIFTVAVLVIQKASKLRLVAWGTMAGHILGFAAIDLYGGTIAMMDTFNVSPTKQLYVLAIYIVTVPCLVLPVKYIVRGLLRLQHVPKEAKEQLHEQAQDTAIDFFCMGASFLVCMITRGFINHNGHGASPHATGPHSPAAAGLLLLFAFIWGAISFLFRYMQIGAKSGGEVLNVLATVTGLTTCWCLLDTGNWLWLHKFESVLFGKVMVAMAGSILFVIGTFLIHFVLQKFPNGELKKSIRGEFLAVSLAVGLAWEHVFDEALDSAGELVSADNSSGAQKRMLVVFFTFLLVLIVFPAWAVYILPRHDPELKKEYGDAVLAPWNACCGDDGEEDEEDYEEDEEEADMMLE